MTIFHVIKYKGCLQPVTNYPDWVIIKFEEWFQHQTNFNDNDIGRCLYSLLEEYDPEIHGHNLHVGNYRDDSVVPTL